MFAGIDCTRGWPPAGMTTAAWLRLPPRQVALADLYATQDGVYLAPLIDPAPSSHSGDPLPHVRLWHGRLLLEDGHHRAVRAALNGQQTLDARVLVCNPAGEAS